MRILLAASLLGIAAATPARGSDPSAAPGLPAVLTLEDALRIAREHGPDRVLADAGVASARAQIRSAGALPNPTALLMAGWSSQCPGPGCNQPSYLAGLGDQGAIAALVTGQRGLAVEAAEHGLRGAEALREDALRELEFQVKHQFVSTAMASQAARFCREEAALAERTLEAARRRREAGASSASDLNRLEVLLRQIEQLAGRADQAFAQARAALARQLGLRSGAATFEVDPGLSAVAFMPPRLASATAASIAADARAHRPDLAAARAQLEQARVQASLQRRLVIPAFQLLAQYAQQGSNGAWFTPPTASVGLTIPLPFLYQRQGEVAQADAGVLASEATVSKVEAQILADVSTAFESLQVYWKNAQRAHGHLAPRARDARNQVVDQYARGTASLLDYLDAQRSLIQSEMDHFASLGDFWSAVFQVERAAGTSYYP